MAESNFLEAFQLALQVPTKKPLHSSGISSADRCKRKFFFSDRDWGLSWDTPLIPRPFYIGNIAHHTLEAYYEYGTDLDLAFGEAAREAREKLDTRAGPFGIPPDTLEKYEKDLAMLLGCIRGYGIWQAHDDGEWADSNLVHLAVEHQWEAEYAGIPFRGRFDGLVRRRDNGEYWLFETKTARALNELKAGLPWDPQRQLYTWAAKEGLGLDIQGVLYNIIQKSNPYHIPTLKSGLPSKAVRSTVQTSYGVYEAELERCIAELELSEAAAEKARGKYESELLFLFQDAPVIYERVPYRATPTELAQHMHWCEVLYRELETIGSIKNARPAKNRFDCPRCPFKEPCLAFDEGADWKGMLNLSFIKKEEYYG